MKYSEQFDKYYEMLIEFVYSSPESLNEIRYLTEAVMALLDLIPSKNSQFDSSVTFSREQFRIDLVAINNAIQRESDKGKEDGFYDAKRNLKADLLQAASKFRFIGH